MSQHKEKEKKFEQAYLAYSEPIFRYCFFRISNRERAKEIMQETFMKTWGYIIGGGDIGNMKAFLYKVAHNFVVNEITRRKNNTSLDVLQEDTGFDPVDEQQDPTARSEIRLALEQVKELGEESSEIMIMRHVEDLSIEEIADILGVSKNVVSVRLHRATEKMRELYNNA